MSDDLTGSIPLDDEQVPTGTVSTEPDLEVTGQVPDEGGTVTREQLLELLGVLSEEERSGLGFPIGLTRLAYRPGDYAYLSGNAVEPGTPPLTQRFVGGIATFARATEFDQVSAGISPGTEEVTATFMALIRIGDGWYPVFTKQAVVAADATNLSLAIDLKLPPNYTVMLLIGGLSERFYYSQAPVPTPFTAAAAFDGTLEAYDPALPAALPPDSIYPAFTLVGPTYYKGVVGPLDPQDLTGEALAYGLEAADEAQLARIKARLGL